MKRRTGLTLAAVFVSAGSAGASFGSAAAVLLASSHGATSADAASPLQEHPELSASQAARLAQDKNGGGRVLAVLETSRGWQVKLLKDGTVRFISVP